MRGRVLVIQGESFGSARAAATHFGISPATAARRLREGWTLEQAFGLVSREHAPWPVSRSMNITTSAGMFRTAEEAAAHFGLPPQTVAKRLRAGWPPDEAVGLAPHNRKPKAMKVVVCKGVEYPNTEAFAGAFSANRVRVYKRLLRGWTPEQAVDLEPAPPRFRDPEGRERSHMWKQVTQADDRRYPGANLGAFKLYVIRNLINSKEYVGITVSPLAERLRGHRAAAREGLPSKLYRAMRLYGADNFSIEELRNDARSFAELQDQEIAEIKARDTIRKGYNTTPGGSIGTAEQITIAGVTYPSRGAAAAHFGVDVAAFNLRVTRLGWTPEQAAEIEARPSFARHRFEADGIKFKSLKSAAEHFGLEYKTVFKRVKESGWSVPQALGLVDAPLSAQWAGYAVRAFGQSFPSVSECARANGVKAASLQRRLKVVGEDPETAIRFLQEVQRKRAQRKRSGG